jgi:hypothetical protein
MTDDTVAHRAFVTNTTTETVVRVHHRSDTGGEANVIAASEQLCRCLSLAGACEMRCEQCEQETRAPRMCQIKLLMNSQHSVFHQRTIIGTHAHTTRQPPTKRKHSRGQQVTHCTRANSHADQQAGNQPPSSSALPTEQQWKRSFISWLRRSGLNIITTVYSCTVQTGACSRWMRCEVRLG